MSPVPISTILLFSSLLGFGYFLPVKSFYGEGCLNSGSIKRYEKYFGIKSDENLTLSPLDSFILRNRPSLHDNRWVLTDIKSQNLFGITLKHGSGEWSILFLHVEQKKFLDSLSEEQVVSFYKFLKSSTTSLKSFQDPRIQSFPSSNHIPRK